MKHVLAITILVMSWGGTRSAAAALVFEATQVHVKAELGRPDVTGIFRFTNEGDRAIEITSVATSCGCTAAAMKKTRYEPGESGLIQATLTIGDRKGKHTKYVTLKTDDNTQPQIKLTLSATIPQVLRIRPRMVYWRQGDDHQPKTIRIEVGQDEPVQIIGVQQADARLSARLKEIEQGKRYEIILQPKPGSGPKDVRVRILTDLPQEKQDDFRGFYLLARILPGDK